jgi:hypothetical protein
MVFTALGAVVKLERKALQSAFALGCGMHGQKEKDWAGRESVWTALELQPCILRARLEAHCG